jgi:hypothetical protein
VQLQQGKNAHTCVVGQCPLQRYQWHTEWRRCMLFNRNAYRSYMVPMSILNRCFGLEEEQQSNPNQGGGAARLHPRRQVGAARRHPIRDTALGSGCIGGQVDGRKRRFPDSRPTSPKAPTAAESHRTLVDPIGIVQLTAMKDIAMINRNQSAANKQRLFSLRAVSS